VKINLIPIFILVFNFISRRYTINIFNQIYLAYIGFEKNIRKRKE